MPEANRDQSGALRWINAYAIETRFGQRELVLSSGDLRGAQADALLISASAGEERPGGATFSALHQLAGGGLAGRLRRVHAFGRRERFSLGDEDGHYPWSGAWAGRLPGSPALRARLLVVVRAPSAEAVEEAAQADAFSAIVQSGFSALAVEEALDPELRIGRLAITELASKRRYPTRERLRAMLLGAETWLRSSPNAQRAEIVLFDARPEVLRSKEEEWRAAMNEVLGRDAGPALPTAQLEEARRSLASYVHAYPRGLSTRGDLDAVLEVLEVALRPEHPRTVHELAAQARRLAEAMSIELCHQFELSTRGSTWDMLNRLEGSGRLAQWIVSYLHTLRTLGNEAVHVNEADATRVPSRLEDLDLFVILANMRRALEFRRAWLPQTGGPARGDPTRPR